MRVCFEPRTRPGRSTLDFVARIDAGKAQHARLAPLLRTDKNLGFRRLQGIEYGLLLRRHDVEAVERKNIRLTHLLSLHARRDQVGQQCLVGMPFAFAA